MSVVLRRCGKHPGESVRSWRRSPPLVFPFSATASLARFAQVARSNRELREVWCVRGGGLASFPLPNMLTADFAAVLIL